MRTLTRWKWLLSPVFMIGIVWGMETARGADPQPEPATGPAELPLATPLQAPATTQPSVEQPSPGQPPVAQPLATMPASEPAPLTTTPAAVPAPMAAPATLPAELAAPTLPESQPTPPTEGGHQHEVLVTANLERSTEVIAPSLGATAYTVGPTRIESIPGGENAPFQQVLLRAPGVVEDSFGQVHVRGEHANLNYRVDGVLLPESIASGIGGFGQELDTRIVQSSTLIDGSLPAEFGFRTAGVVDVTTKTGQSLDHNELSIYGGSYDTIEPGFLFGGHRGKLDYFVAGSYRYSGIGIENPDSNSFPLHDYTNQEKLFTYLGYQIDDTSRLMVLLNASYATFQIPDRPGVPPAFMLAGSPPANSATINENQAEQDYYGVVSYQKVLDKLSFQVSGFSRWGQIHFTPDPTQDLIFSGVAGEITNGFHTSGMQVDASYILDDHNTVRFGLLGDYTNETLDTSTAVFPIDATGAQLSDVPSTIDSGRGNWGSEFGFYLQDEWKIAEPLTLNYGARFDQFWSSFDNENQLSPRVNLVWKIDKKTTAHAGYARYFVPPPVQYVWPGTIDRYAGTSNTPENFVDTPPRAERSNYYDIGVSRQINPYWQITLDGFYKAAKPLLDSGQFGNALILSSFNYAEGKDYGPEISTTFTKGGFSLYGNFAYVVAEGRNIVTNQYLIGNDELAYISGHFIPLDHQGSYTASAGVSYAWKDNRVYADLLYGSGLRAGFANDKKEPQYAPVSVGFEHIFHPEIDGVKDVRFRFDVVNVFDEVYQLRNGTGIGVGASQYGERRGFFAGLTFDF